MTYANPQPIYLQDYQVPNYIIEKVDLEFDLEESSTSVKSTLQIRLNPNNPTPTKNLTLVGEKLELVALAMNGKPMQKNTYTVDEHSLTLNAVPDQFTLQIHTRIKPQENTELSGLYKSSGNFCTQCEAQGFRRITYFLDRPDVMASYTTTIHADEIQYPVLLSNGNMVGSGRSGGNKHWVKWEDPFKKPCYLFALVAGDLEFVEDTYTTRSGRKVTLRIYVEKGNRNKCAHAMQAVKKAMRWDEEKYGREYDLDIYMLVAVSDFNMGAMENKGLNIFNTKYILARPDTATDMDYVHIESVIAHEYFHNWTGNRITCRDWFQLSLKEGLTIFRDQGFSADTTSRTVARIHDVSALRYTQFPEDAGPLAHPVRPDSYIEINNFYTATVYNKGSEVIGMIKTIIGDEAFRKGMDIYFERHDGQAVTIEDFVKAHEDASGVDLKQFRLWYAQSGTPLLTITDHYDERVKRYTMTIKQSCAPTPGQPEKKPFHIPVKIGLIDRAGFEILSRLLQINQEETTFTFDQLPNKPVPSLLRSFSAPVKVKYDYNDEDLITLYKHDTDLFNRWEAGQKLAVNLIMQLVQQHQQGKPLTVPNHYLLAFEHVLTKMQDDYWLLSEMLTLPSEKYIAEQMEVIDVDAIHAAREHVLYTLADRFKGKFLDYFQKINDLGKPYEFNMAEVGKRSFKSVCLSYLLQAKDVGLYDTVAMHQFKKALNHNMTDTIAVLRALSNVECRERSQSLALFFQKWKNEPLVMDKWLAIQASSKLPGTLQNVKKLMTHEVFDIKNPNKVYAVVGAFGQNLVNFHAKSGEGYQFLAEFVLQLDALNPQVAARMVIPLTEWKRYDKDRQQLMRAQLTLLAGNQKLSPNVYEIVSKSL